MSYPVEGAGYNHKPKFLNDLEGKSITPYKQSYFNPEKDLESEAIKISKKQDGVKGDN